MTIDDAWRWIDKAITAGVSAKMANWCADDDEGEQDQRAEAARDRARRAILALLDAEAEACAAEIEGEWWRRGPECAESIRARIAARKGGAQP